MPWTLGYIAGGWLTLELTAFLTEEYAWPDVVTRVLPIVLAFGVLSVITAAWYHGMAGWQRPKGREIAIHTGIAALLLTTLGLWGGDLAGSDPGDSPPLTRVAVLFFKDHSAGAVGRGAAGDLTESVVHRLAQVPALDVLPLTAVEPYRGGETPPLGEVVRDLAVGAMVEGSVVFMGDSVRVNAQLYESEAGSHLGSWEFTGVGGADGRWVPRLAEAVADSIRSRIGEVSARRQAVARATVPAAVELYQRAEAILTNEASVVWREDRRRGLELLEEADDLLREAERLDPEWPDPVYMRIELAEYAARLEAGVGERDAALTEEAIGHATRALEAGRDSARFLERRGALLFHMARQAPRDEVRELYDEAERDLRAAVRLDPGRAEAWWVLSQILERQGAFESAYEYAVRAREEDSFLDFGEDAINRLLTSSLQLERMDESLEWCREGRSLYPRDQSIIQGCLMTLASLPEPSDDHVAEAWALTSALGREGVGMPERRPEWVAWGQAVTAAVIAQQGHADSVDHVLQRVRPVVRDRSQSLRGWVAMFEALARQRLGQTDEALRSLSVFAENLPAEAPRLASEWWFRDLWDDPRYQALYQAAPTESAPDR